MSRQRWRRVYDALDAKSSRTAWKHSSGLLSRRIRSCTADIQNSTRRSPHISMMRSKWHSRLAQRACQDIAASLYIHEKTDEYRRARVGTGCSGRMTRSQLLPHRSGVRGQLLRMQPFKHEEMKISIKQAFGTHVTVFKRTLA